MRLIQAYLEVVTDRATDILFALFSAVPFRLARPVYLAGLAAVYLMMSH